MYAHSHVDHASTSREGLRREKEDTSRVTELIPILHVFQHVRSVLVVGAQQGSPNIVNSIVFFGFREGRHCFVIMSAGLKL